MFNWRLKGAALLLLTAGACLSIFPAQAAAEPLKLRVGIYDNKPKLWTDEHGVAQGLFPDVLNAIAKKESWTIEYVPGTWDEGLARLEANEIDIMPDMALSEERQQKYDFNQETVLVSWGVLYTREGLQITHFNDLAGKNIAVMKNGILYAGPAGLKSLLDSFGIKANIIDVKVYSDVFEKLDKKEVDVGVVNHVFGLANEGNYEVRRSDIFFEPTLLRFAMTKDKPDNAYLTARLDEDLRQMKNDTGSAYYQSMTKHLGGSVVRVEVMPRWFRYLMVGLLLLAALALIYVYGLRAVRRKLMVLVASKTADLQASEESYRAIYEESSEAIMLSVDGRMIDGNPAALKMFRMKTPEEFVGKKIADLSPSRQPDGRESSVAVRDKFAGAVKNGKNHFEWTHRRADGVDFTADVLLTPMVFRGQAAMQATVRDITARKEAEQRLVQLNALKSKFIRVVSHRLRTPLTSVRWTIEEILDGRKGPIAVEQSAVLKMALDSNGEIIQVVNDLIDAMDIEEGRMTLDREEAVFEDVVRAICSELSPRRAAKGIGHVHDYPETKTSLSFDVRRIQDAIRRLNDNAVAYTKEGGSIRTKVIKLSDAVRFEISDDGIGIPAAEQDRIFERFFRASNASAMETDASGLGLYITKNIIEAHDGRIGMASEEGKGSTFWFELPIVHEA